MSTIAVINCSSVYNLGAKKIEKYHRDRGLDQVFPSNSVNMWSLRCEKAYLSAIFTTDLNRLCEEANKLKSAGVEVEIGGPAPTAMPGYVEKQCGIKPHVRLDNRFECVKGNFSMSFTSRGCPNHCPWCIVPKIEIEAIEYHDFAIPVGNNPIISDNNILATSVEHQQLVVKRLRGVRNLDINSGFEAALFNQDSYKLYSKLELKCWRTAFDTMDVENDFVRTVNILKRHGVGYRDIIVYVLIGFPGSTFEDCVYRLEKAQELGCSPYPMLYRPINRIDSRDYVAPGFDPEQLKRLQLYWINPNAWRSCPFEEFQMKYKSNTKTLIEI
jgi:hypothetical protein